jgi:hypothetical protein
LLGTDGERTLQFDIPADVSGSYRLSLRFAARPPGRGASTLELSVNDEPTRTVRLVRSGDEVWSNAVLTVRLKAGINRLVLSPSRGSVAVDAVDVFKAVE